MTGEKDTVTGHLAFRNDWFDMLNRCKSVKPQEAVLAAYYGMRMDSRTLTYACDSEKIAAGLGWPDSRVRERRASLAATGWLTDTGQRMRRAIVWKLTIPECDCRGCRPEETPPVIEEVPEVAAPVGKCICIDPKDPFCIESDCPVHGHTLPWGATNSVAGA